MHRREMARRRRRGRDLRRERLIALGVAVLLLVGVGFFVTRAIEPSRPRPEDAPRGVGAVATPGLSGPSHAVAAPPVEEPGGSGDTAVAAGGSAAPASRRPQPSTGPSTARIPASGAPAPQPSGARGTPLPGTSQAPGPQPGASEAPGPQPGASAAPGQQGPSGPPVPYGGATRTFSLREEVIDIGFPLRESTHYRYRDSFLEPRAGPAEVYNHARGKDSQGKLLRAHDGTDIYVPNGTRVISPFTGVVTDPVVRLPPWVPDRFGLTVLVTSSERGTEGYVALMAHLSRVDVVPGQRVKRGDVLGLSGNTGNAQGGPGHVHFELRAPFTIRLREAGVVRYLDAFDPYRSLRAADPHART